MSTVLHRGTSFVLSDPAGDLDTESERGFYYEDVRCLSTLRVKIDGEALVPLTVEQFADSACTHVSTNARTDTLPASTLAIQRRRSLDGTLRDEIAIESFGDGPARFELQLEADADFADIYTVKAKALAGRQQRREAHEARRTVQDGGRALVLQRLVQRSRCSATLTFSHPATFRNDGLARFAVALARGQRFTLVIEVTVEIRHPLARARPQVGRPTHTSGGRVRSERRATGQGDQPTLECDHPVLAEAYRRAANDLVELRIKCEDNFDGERAIAAGIPWYMALFGRDSLIAGCQTMIHDPALASGTLSALARLQGRRVNPASEEQPGRILHEHRQHLRQSARRNIPTFPYYGSIDSTPLFLIALSEYVRCTGDLEPWRRLARPVERALDWIARRIDGDGDGLIAYRTRPGGFLVNEGWKDSVDSVRFTDGRIAEQPIALVEVQGYAVDALTRMAELHAHAGSRGEAARLRERARGIRARIEDDYWIPARSCYAEALDGQGHPVDALTSNPGHLLWSRAIGHDRARRVADTLLSDEMFSGWGVRTMGSAEGGYNPISYHNGSVWPHDNALLLQGLGRYGLRTHAARLASGLLAALVAEPDHRFAELFAGFARVARSRPIAYPNANKPQAWASGAVILLVRALLGIEVDALRSTLTLRPLRVPELGRLTLRDAWVGGRRVTLRVSFASGDARVEVDGLGAGWTVHTGDDELSGEQRAYREADVTPG